MGEHRTDDVCASSGCIGDASASEARRSRWAWSANCGRVCELPCLIGDECLSHQRPSDSTAPAARSFVKYALSRYSNWHTNMGSKTLALDPAGSQQLAISWSGSWRNVEIQLDGALIGRIETAKQLRAGATFALPDGDTLQLKLEYPLTGVGELHVTRNGVPVPGSAGDPLELVAGAAYPLYFVGALDVSLGLLAELGQVTWLRSLGLGYPTVAVGVLYAVLAYRVMSKHSRRALLLALALLAVSMVNSLYVSAAAGKPAVGRFVVHFIVAATMWRGVTALGELKRNQRPPRVRIPAPPVSAGSGRHRTELALVVVALLTLGASIVVVTRRPPPLPVTPVPEEPANVSFFYSYKKCGAR